MIDDMSSHGWNAWRVEEPALTEAEILKRVEDEIRFLISRFEEPAKRILELIAPQIRERAYDSVLSDDSSGRIHTLVLGQAIQDLYGEDKRLNIVFVQGGRLLGRDTPFERSYSPSLVKGNSLLRGAFEAGEMAWSPYPFDPDRAPEEDAGQYVLKRSTTHADEVLAYLRRMHSRLGQRTLVVTEEIAGGGSIDILVGLLREVGVRAEAASFGTTWDNGDVEESNPYITNKRTVIYLGNQYNTGPTLDSEHLGIWAEGRSGFGHPVVRRAKNLEERMKVVLARDFAKELGHRLADWCRTERVGF